MRSLRPWGTQSGRKTCVHNPSTISEAPFKARIRQHTSADVSRRTFAIEADAAIRQRHNCAHPLARRRKRDALPLRIFHRILQHTSASVSIRRHTSAYVSIQRRRERDALPVRILPRTLLRQNMYLCTSKASNLGTFLRVSRYGLLCLL